MNKLEDSLDYFARQQCSTQWGAFLAAFASEFGQQIPVAELRVLMARLGNAMAQSIPVPAGNTIAELEESINDVWFDMDWGWTRLVEKDTGLFIEHHVAPLQGAFGDQALAWSPAILEGIYAHWFSTMGAASALQITQVEPALPDTMLIVFRFGRAA
jgi:hypothetical protein